MDLFRHRLALHLGIAQPRDLLSLPARALADWMAYSSIEPFGFPRWEADQERTDQRIGHVLGWIWARFRAKGEPTRQLRDFVPSWRGEKPAQTNDQIAEIFKQAITAARGKGARR